MLIDLSDKNIGFIGAGNMAKAIGFSFMNSELIKPSQLMAAAPTYRNLVDWKEKGVRVTTNNDDVLSECDVVFLAMKPQYLDEAVSSLNSGKNPKTKLFISILVGVTISAITKKLTTALNFVGFDVIRIMPNTPISVGAGCTMLCHDEDALSTHVEIVKCLMSAGGACEVVSESMLNPISAICGAGPAYIYVMVEALSDGAVKMGVPRDLATRVVAQTMLGASQMVIKTGKHPGQLKDEVCSPGGSTIAGIHAMEQSGVRNGLMNAVVAATNRAEEIARKFT